MDFLIKMCYNYARNLRQTCEKQKKEFVKVKKEIRKIKGDLKNSQSGLKNLQKQ